MGRVLGQGKKDCLYLYLILLLINNHFNPLESKKSILPTTQVDSGEAEGLSKGDLAPLELPLLEARVFYFCKCFLLAGLEMKLRELYSKRVAAQKLSFNWTCLVQAKTGNKTSLAAILDSESTGRCLHLVVRSSSESEKILR